jgi:hypothetical protein
MKNMMFAIKAEVIDRRAKTFTFNRQKTMYDGKRIAEGATSGSSRSRRSGSLRK